MTVCYKNNAAGDVTKITISTWVYISSNAAQQANTDAAKLTKTARDGTPATYNRIPIMQFGQSRRPRLGIHVGMSLDFRAFLGVRLVFADAGDSNLTLNINSGLWIGTQGTSKDGWYPTGSVVGVKHSDRWILMWHDDPQYALIPIFLAFSVEVLQAASGFFARIDPVKPTGGPIPNYNGFNDYGISPFNIQTSGGQDYPVRPYSLTKTKPATWTFTGVIQATSDSPLGLKKGDNASQGNLINYYLYFTYPLDAPANNTIQPTPTHGPDAFNLIRVPEYGDAGRYLGFGDLIIMFPEYPGADGEKLTYASANAPTAIPTTLYVSPSGGVTFYMTGHYPTAKPGGAQFEGGSTPSDQELVPTLTFTGDGFKLDSWNHIFFTTDLSTMDIAGGFSNLLESFRLGIHLRRPDMTRPPTNAFIVNGKKSKDPPTAQLCVYMNHIFKMAGGTAGLPVIPEDIGRYKVTGKNQMIRYHNTMVWLDKYIEPTQENLAFFYRKSANKAFNGVRPPPSQTAAAKKFGKPHIWMYRDSDAVPGDKPDLSVPPSQRATGIRFEKNHGTIGDFTLVGTRPKDYRPGPGQPPGKDPRKPPGQ